LPTDDRITLASAFFDAPAVHDRDFAAYWINPDFCKVFAHSDTDDALGTEHVR
jgi:hypothetical protein